MAAPGVWHSRVGTLTLKERPQPFFVQNKKMIIAMGVIAFLAIGALVAGGVLFHYKVNTIAEWSLLGSGAGLLCLDVLLGSVVLYMRHRKVSMQQPQTQAHKQQVARAMESKERFAENEEALAYDKYARKEWTFLSLNTATWWDRALLSCMNKLMTRGENPLSMAEASNQIRNGEVEPEALTLKEKEDYLEVYHETITQCGSPDVICLQEVGDFTEAEFQSMIPFGYTVFAYKANDSRAWAECAVLWRIDKFEFLDYAVMKYDHMDSFNSNPDTIVKLRDKENGTTICVASAHLRGFALDYDPNELREDGTLRQAAAGDKQLTDDLAVLNGMQADFWVIAGDFNVTREHYPHRLALMTREGYNYSGELADETPTIYDAALQVDGGPAPVRLDYIYARPKQGRVLESRIVPLHVAPLTDFAHRFSDHLPIATSITYF